MTLKAGYHIQIGTWENDGDNPNINTIVVQTKNEVKFYKEWLQLFDIDKYGNTGDWDWTEELDKRILDLTNTLRVKYGLKEIEETENGIYELNDDIADALGCSEGYVYRVFNGMKVYYIEKDILEYNVR